MPLNHTSSYAELTNDQYAALGKAVVEWANVEYLLGVLLSRLLSTPEFLARTYTDSMSAVKLQNSIAEAVEIHRIRYQYHLISAQILAEIVDINSRVTTMRSMRNRIAHFCWTRNNDNELFGTSFRGGIYSTKTERRDYTTVSLEELSKLNMEAHALVDLLIDLVAKLPIVTEENLRPQDGGD